MKLESYLLAIDGSAAAKDASHLAWNIATQTGASVDAQFVVNTAGAWNLLSCPIRPGFIGSGSYLEARFKLNSILHSIGEDIMLAYRSQAEGINIKSNTYIDEGDPAQEILKRAKNYSLLIIGHRRAIEESRLPSLCEKLIQDCPCPLLVVSDTINNFSQIHARIVNGDPFAINGLRDFVQAVGLGHQQLKESWVDQDNNHYIYKLDHPTLLLWRQRTL